MSNTEKQLNANPADRDRTVTFMAACCVALATVIAVIPGCDREQSSEQAGATFEIDKQYEKGPLSVRVMIDKKTISIADTFTLRLEAVIEDGYELTMPRIGEALGQYEFGLLDVKTPADTLTDDNRLSRTRQYKLEPIVSGTYEIPELEFVFTELAATQGQSQSQTETANNTTDETNLSDDSPEPKRYTLQSEPVAIEVTSLLEEQRGGLNIADIKPIASLPAPPSSWYIVAVPVSAALLITVVAVPLLRGRKRQAIRIFKPAHEVAYSALRRLAADDLIAKNRVKEFYERISNILRHYVEHRFNLHAPERTTEEFFAETRDCDKLTEPQRNLLHEFLQHCDLVKFACYTPSTAEIQKAFDLTKQFIETTKNDKNQVDVTNTDDSSRQTTETNQTNKADNLADANNVTEAGGLIKTENNHVANTDASTQEVI